MQAIDVATLKQHPVVVAALEAAWKDSLPDDPEQRHEEGGWIYADGITGELSVVRAPSGAVAMIDLSQPPTKSGCYVVARFHTHPNPSSEGWYTGPSTADTDGAWNVGVPCLIRADDGVHTTGPSERVGGLKGNPGYPL